MLLKYETEIETFFFLFVASHFGLVLKICVVSDGRAGVLSLLHCRHLLAHGPAFRNHNFQSPKQKHTFCPMLHLFRDSKAILIWSLCDDDVALLPL